MRLTVQPIDDYLKHVWEPHVGSLERVVSRFIQDGLLESATASEKLSSRSLGELQALAREHGIAASGTKAELGERLASLLPPAMTDEMTAHIRLYRATSLGETVIELYRQEEHDAYTTMEVQATESLLRGDLEKAEVAVVAYQRTYRYVVRWPRSTPSTHDQSAYLLAHPQPDLPVETATRRAVAAALVVSLTLGEYNRVAQRVLRATGGWFTCPALDGYLRSQPHGQRIHSEIDLTPKHLADIYAHTLYAEAAGVTELQHLRADHVGHGVQIIHDKNDGCHICSGGKHCYRWTELGELPRIPRHWGCRCCYATWI